MVSLAVSLLASFALLLLNSFFVLAEFAIVKVRSSRIEELEKAGVINAALLRRITANMDAYLSAIQLGITMASLGLGWLAEPAVARLLAPALERLPGVWSKATSHTVAFGTAFILITFLHVLVGELVPKSIAIRRSSKAALLVSVPLHVYYRLVYVPMALLNGASNLLLRLLRLRLPEETDALHSSEEFRILLAHSQERGDLPLSRLMLFENLFDFGETRVREVMTPAGAAAYLSLVRPWEENLAVVRSRKHTRYPLCRKDLSEVLGVVHLKDLWLRGGQGPDLERYSRPALFLQEETLLEKALMELKQKRAHLALVRDARGDVSGLLTLEDILEKLVGEIHDEFEAPLVGSLGELVAPEAVDMDMPPDRDAELLHHLLRRLCAARPDIAFPQAWEVISRRTFAVVKSRGVSLFHGRLPSLERAAVAIGRCPRGVGVGLEREEGARLLFLVLTPLKDPRLHLQLLARVAALASNESSRRNLLRASSPKQVFDVLQAFEHSG